LDLAHISQTSPRTHFATRALDSREKSSEWPQFTGNPRGPEGSAPRTDRRTVTNPNLTLSAPADDINTKILGGSASPLQSQGPTHSHNPGPTSRRGSPHSLLDSLSATTRSVPATPLGIPGNAPHLLKTPGTPHTPDIQALNGRISTPNSQQIPENSVNATDLQASLSRLPAGPYDNGSLTFNSIQSNGRDDVYFIFVLFLTHYLCDANSTTRSMELTLVLTTAASTHMVSKQQVDQVSILPAQSSMAILPCPPACIPLKITLDMGLAWQIVATPVLTAK